MKQIVTLLFFITPLLGHAQLSRDEILSQLTCDSVRYWDYQNGSGEAFFKDGHYCRYDKGRYYTPDMHGRRFRFDVGPKCVYLYTDEPNGYTLWSDTLKMIMNKDTIVGLFMGNSSWCLEVSNDQKTPITLTPMLRKGYTHPSAFETSYNAFRQGIDSLLKTYDLSEEDAFNLLSNNLVVLKIDTIGNVASCMFIKNSHTQKDLNFFERAVSDLCYQLKFTPARNSETNETFEALIPVTIIRKKRVMDSGRCTVQ